MKKLFSHIFHGKEFFIIFAVKVVNTIAKQKGKTCFTVKWVKIDATKFIH